jgi:hypothetical protein
MVQPIQLAALSIAPRMEPRPIKVRDDRPAYGVGGKGFFDQYCKFWNTGEALYFDGEPNIDFVPLNKAAYDKMTEFLDKLDALGLKRAKRDGKEYIPIMREKWSESGEGNSVPQPDSILGAEIKGSNDAVR